MADGKSRDDIGKRRAARVAQRNAIDRDFTADAHDLRFRRDRDRERRRDGQRYTGSACRTERVVYVEGQSIGSGIAVRGTVGQAIHRGQRGVNLGQSARHGEKRRAISGDLK